MPAAAVYFRDPDGHLLEYIAMLDAQPTPDDGVLTWREWTLRKSNTIVAASSDHEPLEKPS